MGLFSRGSGDKLSEQLVLQALGTVQEPELGGDLVSRKMIKDVQIAGDRVRFTDELTTPACPLKDAITVEGEAALERVAHVPKEHVTIEFSAQVRTRGGVLDKAAIPGVSHVIAVAAGKGGVGKSTVAVNLAVALARDGARVGLLDADIYGPNVPLMLGLEGQPQKSDDNKIVPLTRHGVKAISIQFFVPAGQPIIWRGPLVGGAITQFLRDVDWGELDYLVIDLPPGTSDAQLTLAQAVPVSGAVLVTTPQEVSLLDVEKALAMFRRMSVPVLGLVENMTAFICPHCGEATEIFG